MRERLKEEEREVLAPPLPPLALVVNTPAIPPDGVSAREFCKLGRGIALGLG